MRKTNREFIVSWDNLGLESIIEIDQNGKYQDLLDTLADKKASYMQGISNTMRMLLLRAKSNPQRHPEIYMLTTDRSITKEILIDLFKESPQTIVDSIREKGNVVFDGRAKSKPVII